MEFTLLWAVLTGVAFMWIGTNVWSDNLPQRPMDHLIGAAVAGLFIGRIAAMVSQGINPLVNPTDIIIVRGGVHTGAAAVGAVVALAWSARVNLGWLDGMAPAVLAGLAGWHAGCVWRGACLGTVSDLPWAWNEPTSAITRHPVEVYAAIGFLITAWLVGRLSWSFLVRTGSAIALAGMVRLSTEPLRPSLTGGPTAWYVAAILVGVALAIGAHRIVGAPRPIQRT